MIYAVSILVLALAAALAMTRPVRSIAGNTFREAVRQPIYLLTVTAAAVMLALLGIVPLFALVPREEMALTAELAASTVTLAGLVLAIFIAGSVVTEEIEQKTIHVILARGVRRWQFLAGKYLGALGAIALATVALTLVAQAGLYWKFVSAYELDMPLSASLLRFLYTAPATPWGAVQSMDAAEVLALPLAQGWAAIMATGGLMPLLPVAVLSALAMTASIRLPLAPCAGLCFGVYALGHLVDYLSGLALASPLTDAVRRTAAALAPNLSVFDVVHALGRGETLDTAYLLAAFGYAALYVAALLIAGHLLLRKVDLA